MKRLIFMIAVIFMFGSSIAEARHMPGGVTFNFFYSSLRPYGQWIAIENDVYAWRPVNVGRHWAPYNTGRWVWSDYGWYWDSYEPYGWAVYHYGRWYYDDYYGWIWIPDSEWGPAWVEWSYNDDYIGWAPLPPYAIFDIHIGIRFTHDWHFPYRHWNYVDYNHFTNYDVDRYYVPEKYKYRIHERSRYRNEYDYRDGRVFNRGVDKDFVEKRSGSRINSRNLTEVSRLRDNEGTRGRDRDRIEIFRPGDDVIRKSRDIKDFDIKRSDRRSTLDVSKLENRNRETINTGSGNSRREDIRNVPERNTEIRKETRNDNSNSREMRKVETPERNKVERNTPKEEKKEVRTRVEQRESPRIESRERRESERRTSSNSRNETRQSSGERTKERGRR